MKENSRVTGVKKRRILNIQFPSDVQYEILLYKAQINFKSAINEKGIIIK